MGNPFAITFGKTPEIYIPRISQREQVIQDFNCIRCAASPCHLRK